MSLRSIDVSVVIPCYNAARHVRRAVASVMAQTYRPSEVICVDDGSTDDTVAVLQALQAEHGDDVQVLTGQNRGASAARNRGLGQASGTYVQFLDADDELTPEKLRHQVGLMMDAGPADLVVAACWHQNGDGTRAEREIYRDDPWIALATGRLGITSANLWRAEAVRDVGGWNEAYASSQEAELMFRMLAAGQTLLYDDEVHTVHHEAPGAISSTNSRGRWVRYIQLRAAMLDYLRAAGALTPAREEVLHQRIFKFVQLLYRESPEEARSFYATLLPRTFVPDQASAMYMAVFRLMGFDRAEKARYWLKRRRSS